MSKLMSIIHMFILWDWLVDNPHRYKSKHPWLKTYRWTASCPLCEYSKRQYYPNTCQMCQMCPMYNRWPGPQRLHENCFGSAFGSWSDSFERYDYYDTSFFALIIAEEASLLLKEETNAVE